MVHTARCWSGRRRTLIISLALFSCAVAMGFSPARGQGNPAAKPRGSSPSPMETMLRSHAIHEAVEQCAALVEAGDHRRAVPILVDLRRALAKQAKRDDDSARAATCYFALGLYEKWEAGQVLLGKTPARSIEKSLRWDGVTYSYEGKGYEIVTQYLSQ